MAVPPAAAPKPLAERVFSHKCGDSRRIGDTEDASNNNLLTIKKNIYFCFVRSGTKPFNDGIGFKYAILVEVSISL